MQDDKKDSILNLRISRELYEKIKKKAQENRETISCAARKIMEDGCDIFSGLSAELFPPSKSDENLYSYEAKATSSLICAQCARRIKKGEKIHIIENKRGKKIICTRCHSR